MNTAEHLAEQLRMCSRRNTDRNGTRKTRAIACFPAEQQVKQPRIPTLERSTPSLRDGTVERGETGYFN